MCRHHWRMTSPPLAPGVGHDLGERRALALLDGADDLHPQPVAPAEVVDQHPVAGADRGRQLAQAEVADAARGDVRDRGLQQPSARGPCQPSLESVPCGTP